MKHLLIAVAVATMLASCEKNVNFNLKHTNELLVVDANIENGSVPVVVLTNSLQYFDRLSLADLSSTFVHNAVVSISSGNTIWLLKEYTYSIPGGVNIYFYSIDSANLSTSSLGKFNTTYLLQIESKGKRYTAFTTIPSPSQKIDTLFSKPATMGLPSDVVVFVKTADPPGLGNYTRYFTRKNQDLYLPGETSVASDELIDGTSFELEVKPGVDRNAIPPFKTYSFRKGEVVTYKLCNIDKASYDFWNTWEFAYQSNGNPFAQPNKVKGNISNGALGAFYGYAAEYKTITIPL